MVDRAALLLLLVSAGCAGAPESAAPKPPAGPSAAPTPGSRTVAPRAAPQADKPPDPAPAPQTTPAATDPHRGKTPASTRPPASRSAAWNEILKRLRGVNAADADAAFRELWEAPKEWIPDWILALEDATPTPLRELKILVLDRERVTRLKNIGFEPTSEKIIHEDEKQGRFVHDIPGMGKFAYDDIALGTVKSGKGVKVVVKRTLGPGGFPLGVVLRAALLNRFQSSDYPGGDARSDLIGWWQAFYDRVRDRL